MQGEARALRRSKAIQTQLSDAIRTGIPHSGPVQRVSAWLPGGDGAVFAGNNGFLP